jgi:hypothetical protein
MNCTESDSTHLISILKIIPQVHVTPNLPKSKIIIITIETDGSYTNCIKEWWESHIGFETF